MTGIRLELERSGGFAGLVRPPRTLDTAELAPPAADEIARLVDSLEEGEEPPPAPTHRDTTRYEITINRDGRVRRLSFDDVTLTPAARELVRRIESAGTPR